MKQLESIQLTDIYRCAFLLAAATEARLKEILFKNGNNRIAYFLIQGENLEELDRSYRCGAARVCPLKLREELNRLKDSLFSKKTEHEGRTSNDRERKNISHKKLY